MRTAIWLGIGAAMLAAVPAAAMVPVNMQRRAELRAVIDLPALLTLGAIDRIERIAPDLWRVSAGRCHIDVRILARPPISPGLTPPRFEPRSGQRICGRQAS
jgi:hypothetical protein